jgi:uncharacterized membrane protein YbaN (DUF454 family)
MMEGPATAPRPGLLARVGWTSLGLLAVGVGGIGIVVPGLPTTVFFVAAAWAFSKSNPRLEAWVLGLPGVGPLVRDFRAGLGMPRSAKITASVMIVFFVGLSAVLVDSWLFRTLVIAAGLIGLAVVLFRVPTKKPNAPAAEVA